jgi:hypothetical protein
MIDLEVYLAIHGINDYDLVKVLDYSDIHYISDQWRWLIRSK